MNRYRVRTFDDYELCDTGYWAKAHEVKAEIAELEEKVKFANALAEESGKRHTEICLEKKDLAIQIAELEARVKELEYMTKLRSDSDE